MLRYGDHPPPPPPPQQQQQQQQHKGKDSVFISNY